MDFLNFVGRTGSCWEGEQEKQKYLGLSPRELFQLLRTQLIYCVKEVNGNSEVFGKQLGSIRSFQSCSA